MAEGAGTTVHPEDVAGGSVSPSAGIPSGRSPQVGWSRPEQSSRRSCVQLAVAQGAFDKPGAEPRPLSWGLSRYVALS